LFMTGGIRRSTVAEAMAPAARRSATGVRAAFPHALARGEAHAAAPARSAGGRVGPQHECHPERPGRDWHRGAVHHGTERDAATSDALVLHAEQREAVRAAREADGWLERVRAIAVHRPAPAVTLAATRPGAAGRDRRRARGEVDQRPRALPGVLDLELNAAPTRLEDIRRP